MRTTKTIVTDERVLQILSREVENMDNRDHERIKAAEILARYHGLLIEQREVGRLGEFANLTDEELAQKIEALE